MNKEYVRVDDKVVISTDNGLKAPVEYSDYVQNVLVCENLKEVLDKKLDEVRKEKLKCEDSLKFSKSMSYIPATILMGASVLLPWVSTLGDNHMVDSVFGDVHSSTLAMMYMVPIALAGGAILSGYSAINYNCNKKDLRGLENQIDYLEELLIDCSKILDEQQLKNLFDEKFGDKVSESVSEEDSKILKLPGEKELLDWLLISEELKACYDIGYNEKKYKKYYDKGILNDKLAKKYTDIGINFVEKHFQEKGPQKVKK